MTTLPYENTFNTALSARWNTVLDKLQNKLDLDVSIKSAGNKGVIAKNMATGTRIATEFLTAGGDGTKTSTWDATKIQSAIVDLAGSPGLVYIPAGYWKAPVMSTSLITPTSNSIITGAGYGKATAIDVSNIATGNNDTFFYSGVSNCELSNLYFFGAYKGVNIQQSNFIRLERVIGAQGNSGTEGMFFGNQTNTDCYFYDCEAYGKPLNVFEQPIGAHLYAQYATGTFRRFHYLRCTAKDAHQNGFVAYDNTSQNCSWTECVSTKPWNSGFWSRIGNDNNTFLDCEATDSVSQPGFSIQGNKYNKVIGGYSANNAQAGVRVFTNATDAMIDGVIVFNNSQGPGMQTSGGYWGGVDIDVGSDRTVVQNCIFDGKIQTETGFKYQFKGIAA